MKYGLIELHDSYDFNTPIAYKELVRCQDCKYWIEATHGCEIHTSLEPWWEEDFCCYGERRE